MANNPKLQFFGRDVSAETTRQDPSLNYLETKIQSQFEISLDRSSDTLRQIEVHDQDVLELEFEDGFVRVLTAEQLKTDFPEEQERGEGAEEGVINVPMYLEKDYASRGGIKNLLIKLGIISIEEKIAGLGALKLAGMIENRLEPGEGLYSCQDPNKLGDKASIEPTKKPILIMIHGTASSTSGSFGSLVQDGVDSDAWQEIKKQYEDRIYAFEHKTFTKSPVENALDLLEFLPKDSKVHLISHSRGGLVGEILCRNQYKQADPFTELEIEMLRKVNGDKDAGMLDELNKKLKESAISVEKFVRIACPTVGTTLASKRLDIYLTVLLNLIGLIPALKGNPIYGYVKSFLIAFVKTRKDREKLPGIEAMMPTSALVRILNRAREEELTSQLFVIAGDVKPSGIGHSIKVFLTDAFYRKQHDFVVNTISMFGGAYRANSYYRFYSNKEVSHFNYFINKASQDNIAEALGEMDLSEKEFKVFDQFLVEEFEKEGVRGRLDKVSPDEILKKDAPIVYVLPGIMGSRLKANGDSIWVNPFRLAVGQMTRLNIAADEIEAFALMGNPYRALVRELGKNYNVIPFPFDWRMSITDIAKELAEHIEKRLEKSDQPIRILGHSMGGLVAHAFYSGYPDLWKKFSEREGSRLVLLGSPLKGSHVIVSLFLRQHRLFKILHSIDFANDSSDLLKIIRSYPGILELLPWAAEHDFHEAKIWADLDKVTDDFVSPLKVELAKASALSKLFKDRPIDGDNVIYVAGKDNRTPMELEINGAGEAVLWGTAEGDGCVTWKSGIPDKLMNRTWYMDVTHGKLCASRKHFPALLELLEDGRTDKLPDSPIPVRGELRKFVMPEEYPVVLNHQLAMEDAIMGFTPGIGEELPERKVNVQVCQGDLGNAKYPVLVGHHFEDTIVSAESVVDFYMNGRLRQYHAVGVYPGKIETSLVLLSEYGLKANMAEKEYNEVQFKGAVVVGLGVYGELNEIQLIKSFTHALIDYAMSCIESKQDCFSEDDPSAGINIGISSLLIASNYSGLNIRNSIRGILTGVNQANTTLHTMNPKNSPFIGSIEIIEIYKDRAIQACHELTKIIEEPELADHFSFEQTTLREVSGMRSRITYEERAEWWERLKISSKTEKEDCEEDDQPVSKVNRSLEFISMTDRARAPEEIKDTQRQLIDKLIESSVQSVAWNEQHARTLFHLLIPNNFKDYALDTKNLIMVVDDESAKYPWEILHLPDSRNNAPIATQIGLVRQLITPEYDLGVKPALANNVLVVGAPLTPKDKKLAELPAAEQEAREVIEIFKKASYDVTSSIKESGVQVINKLFGSNYKVIHLAGHGETDDKDAMRTGMVLDDDMFITAAEISSLPQTPEFVFINCCYLGSSEEGTSAVKYNELAANVGTQFIRKGVKAVVAAGWAVNDNAAKLFAEKLYDSLFEGETFGEAVKKARNATYQAYSHINTWGAYQCYGDPFYRLVNRSGKTEDAKKSYVDPLEAVIDLQNITNRAEPASSRDQSYLLDELTVVIKGIKRKWLKRSDINEAIGDAYYELNKYEKAVPHYERLRVIADGLSSMAALHKLANLKMKICLEVYERDGRLGKNEVAMIADSERIIRDLINIGKTYRRMSLKGGHYKRKSMTRTRATTVIEDLNKAIEAYREAYDLIENLETNYYSIINWITLLRIHEIFGGKKEEELNDALEKLKNLQEEPIDMESSNGSFWMRTREATVMIYRILETGLKVNKAEKEKDLVAEIEKEYIKNWCNGGSLRKSENILGQINFLIGILTKRLSFGTPRLTNREKERIETIIDKYESLEKKLEKLFLA